MLKEFYKYTLAGVLAAGVLLILVSHLHSPTVEVLSAVERVSSTEPTHLRIPAIKVDAPIESVGQTKAGAMDAPVGPVDAAWYNLGPKPGEVGSAVLDGHSGWKDDIRAVFDNLSSLKPGDQIFVADAKGVETTFIVREIRNFDEQSSAESVFNSSDGLAHLNLITCEGVWDKAKKNYLSRLVVFADKE